MLGPFARPPAVPPVARWRRAAPGLEYRLTDRDHEIARFLDNAGPATMTQVANRFFPGSPDDGRERLKRLTRWGWLLAWEWRVDYRQEPILVLTPGPAYAWSPKPLNPLMTCRAVIFNQVAGALGIDRVPAGDLSVVDLPDGTALALLAPRAVEEDLAAFPARWRRGLALGGGRVLAVAPDHDWAARLREKVPDAEIVTDANVFRPPPGWVEEILGAGRARTRSGG